MNKSGSKFHLPALQFACTPPPLPPPPPPPPPPLTATASAAAPPPRPPPGGGEWLRQGPRAESRGAGARARDAALGFYLVAYNLAQAAGWGLAFVLLVQGWRAGGPRGAWAAAGPLCYVMQCVAGLEVLHAALGLV